MVIEEREDVDRGRRAPVWQRVLRTNGVAVAGLGPGVLTETAVRIERPGTDALLRRVPAINCMPDRWTSFAVTIRNERTRKAPFFVKWQLNSIERASSSFTQSPTSQSSVSSGRS